MTMIGSDSYLNNNTLYSRCNGWLEFIQMDILSSFWGEESIKSDFLIIVGGREKIGGEPKKAAMFRMKEGWSRYKR